MSRIATLIVLCLTLTACKQQADVKLNYSAGQVQVKGLDATTLGGLKRDTLNQEAWQNLFPVTAMPADTDLKDDVKPLPGQYNVSDTGITFKPDTTFRKGVTYLARYYRYDKEISYWDLIFKRRQLGKAEYTELRFVTQSNH